MKREIYDQKRGKKFGVETPPRQCHLLWHAKYSAGVTTKIIGSVEKNLISTIMEVHKYKVI